MYVFYLDLPPVACGDGNADGFINVADAVYLINYIFKGGEPPDPVEAGDANNDGVVNVADPVFLINYVFKGGPAPPSPFSSCGVDATATLECEEAFCTN